MDGLLEILDRYQRSFENKASTPENDDYDLLMHVFGITPQKKRENRQYWGRELGMCWERLVKALFYARVPGAGEGLRVGDKIVCDLVAGAEAIDTKYRIGTLDNSTMQKYRLHGQYLAHTAYRPVLLILRDDSYEYALRVCRAGGWVIYSGDAAFKYLYEMTGFDLSSWLQALGARFNVSNTAGRSSYAASA